MKIHINIEKDIETCVDCPFWGFDEEMPNNGQYCHYKQKALEPVNSSHPPVQAWCPFIVKEENKPDPALTLYNKFREQFPDIISRLVEWKYLGDNMLEFQIIASDGSFRTWVYEDTQGDNLLGDGLLRSYVCKEKK